MSEIKQTPYVVKAALICDDYRREDNGRDMLIGIYNTNALFLAWPSALPKLVLYVAVDIGKGPERNFLMRIVDGTGKQRTEIKGSMPEKTDEELYAVMNFQIQNVTFTEETHLDFLLGIDREPEVVASLTARLAKEKERARFSKII